MAAYLGAEVNGAGCQLVEAVGSCRPSLAATTEQLQQVTQVQALPLMLVGEPRLTEHFLYA